MAKEALVKGVRPTKTYAQAEQRDWTRGEERGILPEPSVQTLDPAWNKFRMEPIAYIREHHYLEYLEPQANWNSGTPLGNGDMGTMVYGAPESLFFMVGRTNLWDYRDVPETTHFQGDFSLFRKAVEQKDLETFRRLQAGNGKKLPLYNDAPSAKPGGMLQLSLFPGANLKLFRQRLSFADGETEITWEPWGDRKGSLRTGVHNTVTVTALVHAARNVLVVQVTPGEDLPWYEPVGFSLWRYPDPEMEAPSMARDDSAAWVEQELPGGPGFILMAGMSEPFVFEPAAGRIHAAQVPKNKTLTIYVTLVTSLDTDDAVGRARQNIADARAAGYEKLRETHRKWWHGFWQRGYLATPWSWLEKKWYYSLYLQASTMRPGVMSPGLQGNWIKEHHPAWNADFHNNINMQVINWGNYTANRLELSEPFYRFFLETLPRYRRDTAGFFQMRGARIPIQSGPDGAETAGLPLNVWIGGSGMIIEHFWWHYVYSGDREFLKDCAYPMLREAALFYEDYLQTDADGRLYAHPTIQMEIMAGYLEGQGKNSTWDFPLVIRMFQLALAAAEILGTDAEDRRRWKNILEKLSPLPATKEGVWLEFADKGGLWHMWDWTRMMPIFPAELTGADSGPAELREQARATIEDLRAFRGEKAWRVGGFSGIMLAAALARMGYGKEALEVAGHACSSDASVSQLNSTGWVAGRQMFCVQVDTPLGFSLILNELLLQSYDGLLRLFPAAPLEAGDIRFHSLRAQGGFLVSAERRNGRIMYAVIKSLKGRPVRLRNPFINEPDTGIQVKIYRLDASTRLASTAEQGKANALLDRIYVPGEIIEFPTTAGETYLVSKEIPWYSDFPVVDIT